MPGIWMDWDFRLGVCSGYIRAKTENTILSYTGLAAQPAASALHAVAGNCMQRGA